MAKKGIDAEIDKVLRIMEANPDTPADGAVNLLNQAHISGDGPLRQKYLRKAQTVIARIDPRQEPEKLQDLQAQVLALQGRGGDTEIAHVTPGELVIPKRMRTPELMAALTRAARQAGIDPARLVVGDRRNAVNPRTGQAEFADPAYPLRPPQGKVETVTVIGIPKRPPNTSLDQNMRDAAAHSPNPLWFYDHVKNFGPWDYKRQNSDYEDFGNFNYDATGAAFGIPDEILRRGAGAYQMWRGAANPALGKPWGSAPYGDDPQDQRMIDEGIAYAKALPIK